MAFQTHAVHGKMMQLVKERSPRNPVLIALVTMSLLPLGVLGIAMYQSALSAIKAAAFQRVELASDLTANTMGLGYAELAAELQVTASLPRIETSAAEMITGFREFQANPSAEENVRKGLLSYYGTTLDTEDDDQQEIRNKSEGFVNELQGPGLFLHDLYVRQNTNETDTKKLLDDAGDGSSYSAGHMELHPVMRSIKERLRLYDILLVDAETRNVVYSTNKGLDFGADFTSGLLQKSGPADAVDALIDSSSVEGFTCVDYMPYGPAGNSVLSLATLVQVEDEVAGVLLFLVSFEQLDQTISSNGVSSGNVSYEVYGDSWTRGSEGRSTKLRPHLFVSDESQEKFTTFTKSKSYSLGSDEESRGLLCASAKVSVCPQATDSDIVWMLVATTP
ncbi:MAG: hypothetical protein HON07_00650, partial [Planctomycetaceae bacterium]|nr:hypothetical protein [Planctomycetaceae bacterium]